jgi:hypothetical protein
MRVVRRSFDEIAGSHSERLVYDPLLNIPVPRALLRSPDLVLVSPNENRNNRLMYACPLARERKNEHRLKRKWAIVLTKAGDIERIRIPERLAGRH